MSDLKGTLRERARYVMTEHARKLLIEEDDPGLLKQLKWCFEGYDVYTAENRENAIAELRRHEPAVILQDLGLPPKPEGVEEGFAALAERLEDLGFAVEVRRRTLYQHLGIIHAVQYDPARQEFIGVADPIYDGTAAGPQQAATASVPRSG